jgi:phosphoglycolate phosphatase
MKYKAVLFDLDGTLLNTLDDLCDAANAVLARHRLPTHPSSAYRYFVGDGVEKLMRRALPDEGKDEARLQVCLEDYRAEYGAHWNVKTRPYPGIPELLDELTSCGMKLTVLSNKPDEFTRLCISRLLPQWRFDVVLGARPGVPKKPDTAAVLEIIRRLKLKPADFIYLGDTSVDMQTANAAGMFAVGALWGFRTREELEQNGAQALVATPQDLLKLI